MCKFSLLDLFRMTALMAVAALLYSIGWKWYVPFWVGGVFGYEIGKRSVYSLVMVGLVRQLPVDPSLQCLVALHRRQTESEPPLTLLLWIVGCPILLRTFLVVVEGLDKLLQLRPVLIRKAVPMATTRIDKKSFVVGRRILKKFTT